jgi:hypothetical protein
MNVQHKAGGTAGVSEFIRRTATIRSTEADFIVLRDIAHQIIELTRRKRMR